MSPLQKQLTESRIERDEQEAQIEALQNQLANLKFQLHQNNRSHQLALEQTNQAYRRSLSFRIGWFITAPFRWFHDHFRPGNFKKNARAGQTDPIPEDIYQTVSELISSNGPQNGKPFTLARRLALEDELASQTATNASNPRAVILFVAPALPAFDQSSGGKRAFRLLQLLAEKYRVIVYAAGEKVPHYRKRLEEIGVRILDPISDPVQLKLVLPQIDVIIFSMYFSYYDHPHLPKVYPNARIILDSVDVHWVRESRMLGITSHLSEEKVQENKQAEILAYRRADLIWAVTENDKIAILEAIPEVRIEIVSNIHEVEVAHFTPKPAKKILFFAGYQHLPNISAVERLVHEILPLIRRQVPDAQLLLAGAQAPEAIKELGKQDGVEFLGFIEEDKIPDLYRSAVLTIVPLLAGAGIKGKICEAICHRVPVLTNDIGNEGIDLVHEWDGFLAESNQEMANIAVRILQGWYPLEKISDRAVSKIQQLVGPETVRKNMLSSLFPLVSICVVTWNRLALLKACLKSIIDHTNYPNFKILVHSNGCTDGSREYLQELASRDNRIEVILSDTNEVFVRPNNRMMLRYPEADVVLLNNDVEVSPGWLLELYRTAYLSEEIGISGAKLLYPDGTLQEFGAELYADGSGRNIGKWEDAQKAEYQQRSGCGYVSGCTMYIKHSTIKKIGTLDDQFHPCYYEDSDYCYTAKEHGLATVVTPKSVVYHHEGATSGIDTETGFKTYQAINKQKFLEKHRGKNNGIDWGR